MVQAIHQNHFLLETWSQKGRNIGLNCVFILLDPDTELLNRMGILTADQRGQSRKRGKIFAMKYHYPGLWQKWIDSKIT